jgi:hypothetical protein
MRHAHAAQKIFCKLSSFLIIRSRWLHGAPGKRTQVRGGSQLTCGQENRFTFPNSAFGRAEAQSSKLNQSSRRV